jgi:uncharacterized protein DUF4383
MVSDRAIRWSAFAFALLFGGVVVLGYIPGINAPVHHHHDMGGSAGGGGSDEHMLMGRYAISLIDDVTHGVTALVLLVTALVSARGARLALAAFGWYYACDAVFYLVTGFLKGDPPVGNLLLNLPHVLISSVMLLLAYRGRIDVPAAWMRAGAPRS